jgi:hypothetical protein
MIVRISGEDQYQLPEEDSERLHELDRAVLEHVESGQEDGFADAYRTLLDYVRTHGTRIGDEEIESSDLILPPPDLSFREAAEEFTGEGLIPD